jgi:hypothetical protein
MDWHYVPTLDATPEAYQRWQLRGWHVWSSIESGCVYVGAPAMADEWNRDMLPLGHPLASDED